MTLTALAATACGPEPAVDEPPCVDLRHIELRVETVDLCNGCFSVDPLTGLGHCRGVVRELTVPETVAVLAAAATARDDWKGECPNLNSEILPLAEHVVDHASEYATLDDIKEAVGAGLGDTNLEVRLKVGCNDEVCWGGLEAYTLIEPPTQPTTCCVGAACESADYTCEWEAAEGVPSTCSPLAP
jgi:hypothetical protein